MTDLWADNQTQKLTNKRESRSQIMGEGAAPATPGAAPDGRNVNRENVPSSPADTTHSITRGCYDQRTALPS